MQHFYQNIHGYFDYQKLYTEMVEKSAYHSLFVEVGSFLGKSSAYMAVEIINSKKEIRFDCIDLWAGTTENYITNVLGLYDAFVDNMKPVNGWYNPIRLNSVEAATLYPDHSIDFVFIDACHDYECVYADIKAWYPKVRPGGYIAGHDYNHPNHPGVKQAVFELLPIHKVLDPWPVYGHELKVNSFIHRKPSLI